MKKILLVASALSILFTIGCNPGDPEPNVIDQAQLEADIKIIDAYLTENEIEAQVHESGVRYVVNNPGTGDSPVFGDRLAVKFDAYDLEGNRLVFDTLGVTFDLNDFIVQSWIFVIPEIQEGGSVTIYSPSGYAYGPNATSFVDANVVVRFEIELLRVIDNSGDQLAVDLSIIDEYISEKNIAVQVHSSGIRYIVLEEGTGASPVPTDIVSVTYEGTFLAGQFFDGSDKPVPFELSNLIPAWQIMIPEMKVGGQIKFYAPSELCYGPTGNATIPPNTVLVFEIGLDAIQ